jgi:hypothetical protein
MENVKVKKSLVKKIEVTAKKMRVSNDRFVSIALEDFFERQQNKDLLEQINEAYKDEQTTEEKRELDLMKQKQAKVLDEWK